MKDHAGLYLARYAEPEAGRMRSPARSYRYVLSIPAFDETGDFLERVLPGGAADLLVIVVANVPDQVSREDAALARTRQLLDLAGGFERARNVDVTIVDRVNRPIPRRAGVGLARKIGADIALRWIAERRIEMPVIYSTDADASLPAGYFEAARGEAAGWVYPFVHTSGDADLARRGLMYELSLRYYVNRLEYAGSPYAFHTVGSCLAIDATSYAKVRGFPRRNAAEDFYLLNKLAKVGWIRRLKGPVIEIEARASTRVPVWQPVPPSPGFRAIRPPWGVTPGRPSRPSGCSTPPLRRERRRANPFQRCSMPSAINRNATGARSTPGLTPSEP